MDGHREVFISVELHSLPFEYWEPQDCHGVWQDSLVVLLASLHNGELSVRHASACQFKHVTSKHVSIGHDVALVPHPFQYLFVSGQYIGVQNVYRGSFGKYESMH